LRVVVMSSLLMVPLQTCVKQRIKGELGEGAGGGANLKTRKGWRREGAQGGAGMDVTNTRRTYRVLWIRYGAFDKGLTLGNGVDKQSKSQETK
jgi:hypothetical protein